MPLATFSPPRLAGYPAPMGAGSTRREPHGERQRYAWRVGRTTEKLSTTADAPRSDAEDLR
jgi:hypothetical protein